MKYTAQELASHGRYGDTELVHMSKSELRALAGLGALANRPITVNPTTGLPEAFSLKSLLPIILGVGATMIGGPMAGAAVSGVTEGISSGDPMRGLMAGALSAGTGAMLGGMGSAGAQAGGQAMNQAALQGAATTPLTGQMAGQLGMQTAGTAAIPLGMGPMAGMAPLTEGLAGQLGADTMGAAGAGIAADPTWAQGMQGDSKLANFALKGVDANYPGWNPTTFGENLGNMDFSGAPGWSPYAAGIGGLGMANYWSEDAAKEEEAKRNAASEADAKATRDRYNYYADMAREINAGRLAPPSSLPKYPG